jgi:tetratricopeptide (TPR) repeat protein
MASTAEVEYGSVATALTQAARLLAHDPALAAVQADEILTVVPGHAAALQLKGAALRRQGRPDAAYALLAPAAARAPMHAGLQMETGLSCAALGREAEAEAALERAVRLDPALGEAWGALGDLFTLSGHGARADEAYARQIAAGVRDEELMAAAAALCAQKLPEAERLLRARVKRRPTDVAAIRMLAEVGARLGRYGDAEKLLTRCLELAPSFEPARHNLAVVLVRQSRFADALIEIERLMARNPHHPSYRNLKAAALSRIGEYDAALALYEGVVAELPEQPKVWMSYGHTLKTAGRTDASITAYRESIARAPHLGESYWSLANLKTFRFTPNDIAAMEAQLARADLDGEDRFHFHYALGKAYEDAREFARSFTHYAEGARLRRERIRYDADANHQAMQRARAFFTPEIFAGRAGAGASAPDPIFVVGLPRAGSTLIEQILSSHSLVEGTMELPDLGVIARSLGDRRGRRSTSAYPESLGELDHDALRALGEDYLARVAIQRKTDRPFFIDKMPNNFEHAGLIHLILPNARIVDARRHPLGNCFSAFKQHFARGQAFSYDLEELGRYYGDYVALMDHFDRVLPGRVHRVFYERMVEDTESEIRSLLDYCGLAFEPACLEFHANERAVRTASSEQVRQPIFTDAKEHWRNYEPWLDPLKRALGDALTSYPGAR